MQLDLNFDAKIFVFPPARRIGFVRLVAADLLCLNGAEAEGYWKDVLARLRRELAQAGVTGKQTHPYLYDFHAAVQDDIARLNCGCSSEEWA